MKKTSRYRVTAQEYEDILGTIENYRVDRDDSDGHTYNIVTDIIFFYSDSFSQYIGFDGIKYIELNKYADEEIYTEKEINKDSYDIVKKSLNNFVYISDKFSSLTYNLETKTYEAKSLLIEEQGEYWVKFNDLSISFVDGKLVSLTFTFTEKLPYGFFENFLTYSEIGTAIVEFPEIYHIHTYSEEWSYNPYSDWHESTCNHEYANKFDNHEFESGICKVCGYNVLTLSEDGTTILKLTNDSITSVTIPKSVTTIGEEAFANTNLTEIVIPEGVTTIEKKAFYNCYELKKVVFSKSVMYIGKYAFSCSRVTEVILPEGLLEIGEYAFAYCIWLQTATLPSTLNKIDYAIFSGCESLTTVNLTEGIKEIASLPFINCTLLTEIIIPKSITTLSYNTFTGSSITKIYYKGNATEWDNLCKKDNLRLNDGTVVYFYSETEPDETNASNLWHYDEEGNVVVWPIYTFTNDNNYLK